MADIDYEALLRKYIGHVDSLNGATYVGAQWFSVPRDFTFEEACALQRLASEAEQPPFPDQRLKDLITPEVMQAIATELEKPNE
jgi:hypothetical protein